MIERAIHGNRSHIYRDMIAKLSRNHMKKMLRDWLLTVGVSQNHKKHMLSKTVPNILKHILSKTVPSILHVQETQVAYGG
jgi:hypothetical protein